MQTSWSFSARYIDTDLDRPRWRTTLNYRVLPSLQLGVEFNPAVQEVNPLATLRGRAGSLILFSR